jgi:putative hydrolase of the HAD superfamily
MNLEKVITNNCPPLEPIATNYPAQLNPLPPIKAVLFDIYGTLFISGSGDVGTAAASNTAEALSQALAVSAFQGDLDQAGLVGIDLLKKEIQSWHDQAKANGIDYPEVEIIQVWQRVLKRLCNTETITTTSADLDQIKWLALAYECRVNPVAPMPHADEVIQKLHAQGLKLGIVSNAQFYTPLLFSAFFNKTIEQCGFDPSLCSFSYRQLRAKPSLDLFPPLITKLQQKHNITPAETLYVGNDMLNDIWTAKQAGCKTALFAGDQRSLRLRNQDDRCKNLSPDAVITNLPQLLKILPQSNEF